MNDDQGVELQHCGKSAEVSFQGREGSSEDEPGIANNTESSKVHPRQLDVSILWHY
jgi:hypothetical protein